jgi:hypothetical protein
MPHQRLDRCYSPHSRREILILRRETVLNSTRLLNFPATILNYYFYYLIFQFILYHAGVNRRTLKFSDFSSLKPNIQAQITFFEKNFGSHRGSNPAPRLCQTTPLSTTPLSHMMTSIRKI